MGMKIFEKDGKDFIEYEIPDFNNNKDKEIGKCLEDFEILNLLEINENNKLFKVKSKKNYKIYAIKQISLEQNLISNDELIKQIEFFKNNDHPNIVKCFDYFFEDKYIYIIMEYMNNGGLESYNISHNIFNVEIQIEKKWEIVYRCLCALAFINDKGYSRNIDLKNILFDDNFNIKIGIMSLSSMKIEFLDVQFLGKSLKKLINSYDKNKAYSDDDSYSSLISFISYISEQYIDSLNAKYRAKAHFIKYCIKNSSIEALFYCLNTYKNIRTYFSDINVSKYFSKKYKIGEINTSKLVLDIFINLNKKENVDKEMLKEEKEDKINKFRKAFQNEDYFKNYNVEIPLIKLVDFVLYKLNTELNEVLIPKNKEDENKTRNDKKEMLSRYNWLQVISEEDEKLNFEKIFNIYKDRISSLISRNFMSFIETIDICQKCKVKKINFSWYFYFCIPGNKNDMKDNVKKVLENSVCLKRYSKKVCEFCFGKITLHEISGVFHKLANDLIILLDRKEKLGNKLVIDFDDDLDLYDKYEEKIINFKLKAIILKKLEKEEYVCYLKDDFDNKWKNKEGKTIGRYKNDDNINNTIALFYELNKGFGKKIKSQENLNYQLNNSFVSQEINFANSQNSVIFFNDIKTFNKNNNNFIHPFITQNSHEEIDLQLKKNINSIEFSQINYPQLNLNNNNSERFKNMQNTMNNLQFNKLKEINNISNENYKKIPSSRINPKNILYNKNIINDEIRERAFSCNISSNYDKIEEIPIYTNEPSNFEKIEYIPGKKLSLKIDELS